MKIDAFLLTNNLKDIPAIVAAAETTGFDGLWAAETAHDPFLPLVLAAEHSRQITLGTGIAVAFPRSPATLAYTAWDLARYSRGRFILGLGTQVKAHNERRFGVPWGKPVPRLREVILAIRAFWDCWQNGTKLNFRGEYFKLTLMTPFFNPGPHAYPDIPIFIAAVNKQMCRLAGELCQGLYVHPLHTARYIEEAILPNVQPGLEKEGRRREDIQFCSSIFVIPTDDPQQAKKYKAEVRRQIAFYASTPSYRAVMELHDWGDAAAQLGRLASRKRWDEMTTLISDEMLDAFAVEGTWQELPGKIQAKYKGNLLDRVSYYLPYTPGERDEPWQLTVAGFKG